MRRLSAEQLSASMRVQRVSVQRPKIVQMEVFRVFRVTRLKHLKHLKPLNRLKQVNTSDEGDGTDRICVNTAIRI